jgi:hypothetical protein
MKALVQRHRIRLGRTYTDVHDILLLPAGLAGGLGREVLLPYRILDADSPQKLGSPASPMGIGELGGQPDSWLTINNVIFFPKTSIEFDLF